MIFASIRIKSLLMPISPGEGVGDVTINTLPGEGVGDVTLNTLPGEGVGDVTLNTLPGRRGWRCHTKYPPHGRRDWQQRGGEMKIMKSFLAKNRGFFLTFLNYSV